MTKQTGFKIHPGRFEPCRFTYSGFTSLVSGPKLEAKAPAMYELQGVPNGGAMGPGLLFSWTLEIWDYL